MNASNHRAAESKRIEKPEPLTKGVNVDPPKHRRSGALSLLCVPMNEWDKAQERYRECVKDLDRTLHVGGFPARAIVVEPVDGHFILYKKDLRPDKAINLLRSLAKNEERRWLRIHSVNQKTKTRVDTIHNEAYEKCMADPACKLWEDFDHFES